MVEKILCVMCTLMEVENDEHCLIKCDMYANITIALFNFALDIDNSF